MDDRFASLRGLVDDRFLADERIPAGYRLEWGEAFVAGQITPAEFVARVQAYLAHEQAPPPDPGPITEAQAVDLGGQLQPASEMMPEPRRGVGDPAETGAALETRGEPVRPGELHSVHHSLHPPGEVDEEIIDAALAGAQEKQGVEDARAELPLDILRVWGNDPADAILARALIQAWGLEAFRASSLHQRALAEIERRSHKAIAQTAFVKAMKKKEKP